MSGANGKFTKEVCIIVPGAPLCAGDRDAPRFVGRTTRTIGDTITNGRALPIKIGERVVGEATVMDFIKYRGEDSLLFRAHVVAELEEVERYPGGALVGGMSATVWLTGIFPQTLRLSLAARSPSDATSGGNKAGGRQ